MNTTNQTIKNRINRELAHLATYWQEIPLDAIFSIVSKHAGIVVQEDGTPWSGFLLGESGGANFSIEGKKFTLRIDWYKMASGNYEITAYVS